MLEVSPSTERRLVSIYLIRHGETPMNATRVLQPPDTPLSERGQAQARALAERLASLDVTAILSSDLLRALDTARAISALTGHAIETTPLLQERNFGDLRGLAYDSLDHDPIAAEHAPPGGESMETFRQRVRQAFDALVAARARAGGNLAVVTHGLVIRTILARHVAMPAGEGEPEHVANTSLTIFDATAPYTVTLLNCARHLEGEARDDGRGVAGI